MALISLGLAAGKAILGGKSSSSAARPQVKQSKISSSAFRSQRATTQKIPKTTPLGGYGFSGGGGPLPKNAFLMPQVSRGGDTLEETNNILIDIQKLLVLDFSYRIESAKQLEKNIRAETEQNRRSRKEALLEGGKKIGRATSSVISKITAPAKSFLDKVFGFLGSIFQGFLANKALKWLADEKNQEDVGKVFKFLEKNWNILLGIAGGLVGGVVVAKVFSKLYTMYRITRGLLRLAGIGRGRGRGRGGDTIQDGGKPRRVGSQSRPRKPLSPGSASRFAESNIKAFQGKADLGDKLRLFRRGGYKKGLIGKALQLAQVGVTKFFKNSGLKYL